VDSYTGAPLAPPPLQDVVTSACHSLTHVYLQQAESLNAAKDAEAALVGVPAPGGLLLASSWGAFFQLHLMPPLHLPFKCEPLWHDQQAALGVCKGCNSPNDYNTQLVYRLRDWLAAWMDG